MMSVKEAIIVEGRYDKNTLSQAVDALIIETGGFALFNDKEKQTFIRKIAQKRGIIVLTDSDGAGFVIRNFLRGCVDPNLVKHAYIPDVLGKERRKSAPSKEGKLGVEGMKREVLIDALLRAGATIDEEPAQIRMEKISKLDLYRLGYTGGPNSREKRAELLKKLELPERLTTDGLLDILNATMEREEFLKMEIQEL